MIPFRAQARDTRKLEKLDNNPAGHANHARRTDYVINCGDNKWLYKRTSGELSEYRVRRSNRQILYGYKPSGGHCAARHSLQQ